MPTPLFRVVSERDDIVVGFSPNDLRAMDGDDALAVGAALNAHGVLPAWRYTVGRNSHGNLQYAPMARVSLLAHRSIRIEPYASALPVVGP
jgi:hypothetical protein